MPQIKSQNTAVQIPFASWQDVTPFNATIGTMLHNKTGSWRYLKPVYEDKLPACQNACPAGNDIEGWIKLLNAGKTEAACWHLKREQPFPAILGRVCFKFCQPACNRSEFDAGVNICELERYIGAQLTPDAPHPDLPPYHGATLAVAGSGPAGMAAAYFGRLLGFKVTIFEKQPVLGGLLRIGIPAYRLPVNVVENEFKALAAMGIAFKTGVGIGRDLTLADLSAQHDYVFLATGAHRNIPLELVSAGDEKRLVSGLALLTQIALGRQPDVGRRVAVIGGGNTAVDVARSLVRTGADVQVVYRRSESEMPAHPEEVREAREEGVHFCFLAAPKRIQGDKLICNEMQLGPPDESGRRRPVAKDAEPFEIAVDTVVAAIGETPDLDYWQQTRDHSDLPAEPVGADRPIAAGAGEQGRIFAGGDIIAGPRTVVHALAAGKRAAIAMDCDRRGIDPAETFAAIALGTGPAVSFGAYTGRRPLNPVIQNQAVVVEKGQLVFDYFQHADPVPAAIVPAAQRRQHWQELHCGYTPAEAEQEAARCLHCGRCTECDNCIVFCPDMSIGFNAGDRFGYQIDYDYCKGCGICANECPRDCITMVQDG